MEKKVFREKGDLKCVGPQCFSIATSNWEGRPSTFNFLCSEAVS